MATEWSPLVPQCIATPQHVLHNWRARIDRVAAEGQQEDGD